MTTVTPLHPDNLLRLLRELVRFPTANPPGNEEPAARFVQWELRAIGCETVFLPYEAGDAGQGWRNEERKVSFSPLNQRPSTRLVLPPGPRFAWGLRDGEPASSQAPRAHVVGRLRGTGERPGLMLSGHLDVFPAGTLAWNHDPFEGKVVRGRLYGRGACHMKAGLAALIAAAAEVARSGTRLRGDLVICASADEENGCRGAEALVREPLFDGVGAAVIAEPSELELFTAQKGALWLEVTVTGKSAHGSTPHAGANAVAAMAEFLTRVPAAALDGTRADPLLGHPTINIGTIHGGVKINDVPDICTASLDIRTVPGQRNAEVQRRVDEELRRVTGGRPGTRGQIRTLIDAAPVSCPVDSPVATAAARAVREVTGREVSPGGVPFITEASVFVPALGLPMVICGPGDHRLAHQPDEYVKLGQVEQAAQVYVRMIREMLA